jgi:hypothetical protein
VSPSVALVGGSVNATLGAVLAGGDVVPQLTITWNFGLPAVAEPSPAE